MQLLVMIVCLTGLAVWSAGDDIATPWIPDQDPVYPRLFFDPGEVRMLRQKAFTTHSHIARVIRGAVKTMMSKVKVYLPPVDHEVFTSRWNEVYGNNLGALAMYCVLFPDDRTALRFTIEYMDRMASYPRWHVRDAPNDEVPVAHSLTGFATAFDFLQPHLDPEIRLTYLDKIAQVTEEMYDRSHSRSWGLHYLHNHQATNMLALLTGALVARGHAPAADLWAGVALKAMERTMILLEHVVDGSLDEGVAYGSYTSRSLTQYVFLALRHFGIDHRNSTWLSEHFWFYYATVLPGYQRTVGIADSNYNWFYGPESQLVFLDRFVLQNGSGNWLALQIRQNRPHSGPMEHSSAHRWSTLHTEYIWYDAQLQPRPPAGHGVPHVHLFTDWGVVTYGGGLPKGVGNTFVSFKSGKLGGRAVFDIVHRGNYLPWINGWKSFNPGHEHPDHNSFTFAPNGHVLVSEALYGPKLTHLNNVLTFAPTPQNGCNVPWEGQLGECGQWLHWLSNDVGEMAGEIISASQHGKLLFVSGEAVGAYAPHLGLRSVYRSLMLLNPETLLVLDHVERIPGSPVQIASAFFHNLDMTYPLTSFLRDDGYNGATMDVSGELYGMFSFTPHGQKPNFTIQRFEQTAEFKTRWTQFANITFELKESSTRMAYVFYGPQVHIGHCVFQEVSKNGVRISLEINGGVLQVSICTAHQDPSARFNFLGFGGHALLQDAQQVTRFGLDSSPVQYGHDMNSNDSLYLLGMSASVMVGLSMGTALVLLAICCKLHLSFQQLVHFALIGATVVWVVELIALWLVCSRPLCGLIWDAPHTLLPVDQLHTQGLDGQSGIKGAEGIPRTLPTIVIASLPVSGAELLKHLFVDSTDIAYIGPSARLLFPSIVPGLPAPFIDACEWSLANARSGHFPQLQSWLQSFLQAPQQHLLKALPQFGRPRAGKDRRRLAMHFPAHVPPILHKHSKKAARENINNIHKSDNSSKVFESKSSVRKTRGRNKRRATTRGSVYIRALQEHFEKFPHSRVALSLWSGSWTLKLPFLRGVVGPGTRALLVVRDPRAWVHALLYGKKPNVYTRLQLSRHLQQLFQEAGTGRERCTIGSGYAFEYEALRHHVSEAGTSPVSLLAHLWFANTAAALRTSHQLSSRNFLLLRFEDLVEQPRETAQRLFRYFGLPLPPAALNQLLLATWSHGFPLPYEAVTARVAASMWKERMSRQDIQMVEDICLSLMNQLGYDKLME
uniref:Dermatan sulfate epimerase like a n=1 Tax=Eptatretus burgeri TaxID=7764 RepID=A0A8C4R6W3_EPTBU